MTDWIAIPLVSPGPLANADEVWAALAPVVENQQKVIESMLGTLSVLASKITMLEDQVKNFKGHKHSFMVPSSYTVTGWPVLKSDGSTWD